MIFVKLGSQSQGWSGRVSSLLELVIKVQMLKAIHSSLYPAYQYVMNSYEDAIRSAGDSIANRIGTFTTATDQGTHSTGGDGPGTSKHTVHY